MTASSGPIVPGILAAVATLGLVLCNFPFLPVATGEFESAGGSFFGFTMPAFDFRMDATFWGATMEAGGEERFESWYSDDAADDDAAIKVALPLFLVGLLAAVAASLLMLAGGARSGGIAGMVAVLLTAIATTLLLTGLMNDDGSEFYDLAAGFWVLLASGLTLLAASIWVLVAPSAAARPASA